nr:HAD family hydrolase [Petrachloros mirabilis]
MCCAQVCFADIEAVVFDKDGTLASVEPYLRQLGQMRSRLIDAQVPGVREPLLLALGLENDRLNPQGLLAVGSRQENAIAAAAYVAETGRDWIESLDLVLSAFVQADQALSPKAQHTPPIPDGIALLQALHQASLKIGVLSADTPDQVQAFLDTHQLLAWVHAHQGVAEGTLSKPNPILLRSLCQTLNVAPAHTLMIGDSAADGQMAEAARAAGAIGVTWGWPDLTTVPATTICIQNWQQIQVVDAHLKKDPQP